MGLTDAGNICAGYALQNGWEKMRGPVKRQVEGTEVALHQREAEQKPPIGKDTDRIRAGSKGTEESCSWDVHP